jgi:hypothetical protein
VAPFVTVLRSVWAALSRFFSGYGPDQAQGNLETENGDNLVQEDGGLLLLE